MSLASYQTAPPRDTVAWFSNSAVSDQHWATNPAHFCVDPHYIDRKGIRREGGEEIVHSFQRAVGFIPSVSGCHSGKRGEFSSWTLPCEAVQGPANRSALVIPNGHIYPDTGGMNPPARWGELCSDKARRILSIPRGALRI